MAYDDASTKEQATALRRLCARHIDIYFAVMLIILPLVFLAPPGLSVSSSPYLLGLAFTIACYVVVAAQQAFFGNSAGKYILGIKAVTMGQRPRDLSFFLEREARVLVLGQAFGLQFASTAAGIVSFYFLRKDGVTHYDRNFSTVVRHSRDARRLFWLIPMFAPAAILITLIVTALSGAH